jgi:hypothetical protein
MLTADRLTEIAGEIADDVDSPTWLLREGIDVAAMRVMFESVERQLHEKIAADGDVVGAVIDLTGQAFRLGWDCAKKQRA